MPETGGAGKQRAAAFGRGARIAALAVGVLILAWLLFGQLGFFLTVQKYGGWTNDTSIVDFSAGRRDLIPDVEGSAVDSVILLLGDGIGFAHVTAARAQLGGINDLLVFERFPVRAWLDTHAVESIYCDSAAAATALASGRKTRPGSIGVDSDGARLPSLFAAAEAAGRATGWITDSYFFDATPAAFATAVGDRDDYEQIVAQIVAGGSELVIGELRADYPPSEGAVDELVAAFSAGGWRVARTERGLAIAAAEPGGRVAGIFSPDSIADDEREPVLGELFELALTRLAERPEGFFLVAEVEDPDSGSHNADFPRVVRGVRHLDELATRALDFARRDGRTLVVVTSDHETGGLTLITGGPESRLGIRWATTNHSGAPVPLYAYGPGASALAAARDNTDVAPIVARLAGLDLPAPF